MRDIKFRAWDESEKQFWYFTLQEILERRMSYRGSWDTKVMQGEKTQYTGLKDINGKEIYEGDVVNYKWNLKQMPKHQQSEIHVVEWDSYGDGEYVDNIECWMLYYTPLSDAVARMGDGSVSIEVRGNIYENKELLEDNVRVKWVKTTEQY